VLENAWKLTVGAPKHGLDVARIASLASIALSASEERALQSQLDRVLSHVALLLEVEASSVDDSRLALEAAPLARDQRADSLSSREALAQAPLAAEGQFAVARFVEG
jgi:aspartyl/glutamyl-tRNA(Asn/Gln) amidotransferase C subunit